jgi:sugar (pentulose or hexulose) kinase
MKEVTAVFDIGKTNKKFFLFDEKFREVFREYTYIEEAKDEDGYLADNLLAINQWLKQCFNKALGSKDFRITAVNFSSYGASFVHIDAEGKPVTPLYNYLKPYPPDLQERFRAQYGTIATATGSPESGMLNSGMQLYWLKHARPEAFARIRWSLHLPQYLSYVFTGIPLSEYTSIGCHTGLWDYERGDYHQWVYAEGIEAKLPPIVTADTGILRQYDGRRLPIGVGVHDSSAALLPYLRASRKPFALISTGTWSISLNPFSKRLLTEAELANNALHYLRVNGEPVRASRLLLGKEYSHQVAALSRHFAVAEGAHRQVAADPELLARLESEDRPQFHFAHLSRTQANPAITDYSRFNDFRAAYHQLMRELVAEQVASLRAAIGDTPVKKVYIDGGFADNDIFVKLLAHRLPEYQWRTTQSPLGSALGAALVISERKISKSFLKKHYAMRKHELLNRST